MATFMEDKFWMVLPYELVRELVELMLWPAAVKEERERKPRLLCDHSWDWGWDSLNDTTTPHAQIGRASCRERLVWCRSRWSPYH